MPRPLELLAPARDADIAIEAIKHGADAVYIGGPGFGARASAGNAIDDIQRVIDFAHQYDARVYVTVNTILYDSELLAVEKMIHGLYRIGTDALIVQDMGILRLDIPPIALHASTQCDTRNVLKAKFLQEVGFSQIVLAREMTIHEIREVCAAVDVPVEAFIHGALCVSYSGDCQASCLLKGRSANRGECAQICRLPYDLMDAAGHRLIQGKHLLSLRDLNQSARLAEMADAGVASFKIEGRLKDVSYVKNTVAFYRQALDELIDSNPEKYVRASAGDVELRFKPSLSKSFNRGFTNYFLGGSRPTGSMASIHTPKSQGEFVGTTVSQQGNVVTARLNVDLSNGDGLCFINRHGEFQGFRLNRIEGDKLYPASKAKIPSGTRLYRNLDKRFEDALSGETAQRRVTLDMALRATDWGLVLELQDSRGCHSSVGMEIPLQEAKSSQNEARKRVLTKLGETIFKVVDITDEAGDVFVPASLLASLRRQAIEGLERAHAARYQYSYRREEKREMPLPQGNVLTYHDNVSNSRARDFYSSHGATVMEPALEIQSPGNTERVVMSTRYCIRREMGYCLKDARGKEWPSPLYLQSGTTRMRLDFDCSRCMMRVVIP